MHRAALYARVSTGDQTVAPQLDALREYAEARKLQVTGEYVDEGWSGSQAKRPALERLMTDVRRRRVDAVVVTKLDRLARSVAQLCELAGELEALGVALVVIDQAIDTTTPTGRFLYHALAAVAELERALIIERTRAGVQAARRRGKHIGRPAALDAEKRQRLGRLLEAGRSQREIAARLGVGKGTVGREIARLRGQGEQAA